ncbi:hypothetical protein SLOPH_700 [Spraguea lophii 42_110]|uniref:Uncharacterized protein n=1 Tax=Spraguea lophii (strain 42_110) TaxID=1358809 RepID=S7WCZ4_SPRLO|nr:hypothetical protein SLOPH_700 [Spraguea lophii 42_110]
MEDKKIIITKENIKNVLHTHKISYIPTLIEYIPIVLHELNTIDYNYKNKLVNYLYYLFKLPFNLSKIVNTNIIEILLNKPNDISIRTIAVYLNNIHINNGEVCYRKKNDKYYILENEVTNYIYYEILSELSKYEKINIFDDHKESNGVKEDKEVKENINNKKSKEIKENVEEKKLVENNYKEFLKERHIIKNHKINILTNQALLSHLDKKIIFNILFSELKQENNILSWNIARAIFMIVKNSDKSYFNNFKEVFTEIFCRETLWTNLFIILSMLNYESVANDLELEDKLIFALNYFKKDRIVIKLREAVLFYIYTSKNITEKIYLQVVSTALFDPDLNCRRAAATIIAKENNRKEAKVMVHLNFNSVRRYENVKKYFNVRAIVNNEMMNTLLAMCFYYDDKIQHMAIKLYIKHIIKNKHDIVSKKDNKDNNTSNKSKEDNKQTSNTPDNNNNININEEFIYNKKEREVKINNKYKVENIEEISFIIFMAIVAEEFYRDGIEINDNDISLVFTINNSEDNMKEQKEKFTIIENNYDRDVLDYIELNSLKKDCDINPWTFIYLINDINLEKYKNNIKYNVLINALYKFYKTVGYVNCKFLKETIYDTSIKIENNNKIIVDFKPSIYNRNLSHLTAGKCVTQSLFHLGIGINDENLKRINNGIDEKKKRLDINEKMYSLLSRRISTSSILINRNNTIYSKEIFKKIISPTNDNKIEQLKIYKLPSYRSNFYYQNNGNNKISFKNNINYKKNMVNRIIEMNINSYKVGVEDIGFSYRKECLMTMVKCLHPLLPNYFIKLLADKSKGLRDNLKTIIEILKGHENKIDCDISKLKKEYLKYNLTNLSLVNSYYIQHMLMNTLTFSKKKNKKDKKNKDMFHNSRMQVKDDKCMDNIYKSFYTYSKKEVLENYCALFKFIRQYNPKEDIFYNLKYYGILLTEDLQEELMLGLASTIKNSTRKICYDLIKSFINKKPDLVKFFIKCDINIKEYETEYEISDETEYYEKKYYQVENSIKVRKIYLFLTLISIYLCIESMKFDVLNLDGDKLLYFSAHKSMLKDKQLKDRIEILTKIKSKRIRELAILSLSFFENDEE